MLTLLPLVASAGTAPLATVDVATPSEFARADEPLVLSFAELGVESGVSASSLVALQGEQVLPSQLLDTDGDEAPDSLLVSVDLEGAGREQFRVVSDAALAAQQKYVKRTQAEISRKEGGQWQGRKYIGGDFVNVSELTPPPEHTDHSEFIRYEGPGIESDRVGYRVYLDERNGFDIFGKRVPEPVLQKVGLDGFSSYHEPADWGLDVLKVGASLGMGGYGYWQDGAVQRVSDVSGWTARILENGALQSSFSIDYRDWQVAGKTVQLHSTLTMQAGSRLVKVVLESSEALDNLVTGLVRHPGTEVLKGDLDITGEAFSYLATWGQQSLDGGKLGMAVLFHRKDLQQLAEDEANHVAVLRPRGTRVEYYFLSAWDGEPNGIKNRQAFSDYLEQEAERLTIAPRVQVTSAYGASQKQFPVTAAAARGWAQAMVDSEIARHGKQLAYGGWDDLRQRPSNWEYTTGLLMQAYDDVGLALNDSAYNSVAEEVISSFVAEDGSLHSYDKSRYNIDSINSGKMLLRLYQRTGEERYRKAADQLREQLQEHPRVSAGAFWHKQRYPWQLWLDGVYMGMPFLAHYSQLFENGASLEEVIKEFEVSRDQLRDPETGLYWHAWDEKKQQVWADPDTGRSALFWGRGLGWLAMALVDTLDYIPAGHEEQRQVLVDMTRQLADALLKVQDDSGTWYQILDRPDAVGNYREASASSMFTYMLAKGVNNGILPASYREAAVTAYEGLVREFVEPHPDGSTSLTHNCQVAGLGFGRDGSYQYYMSEKVIRDDPKGLGPFVFASLEIAQLLQ
ncbi:glycoside hydrolase family 88 protein [Parahaliea aestuarii]|uniref:Glycoside hydrolase family 88 protein n=2 Tax=Parahaliea aestuarii TaxID=1852021 RepID=A0A5C8ZVH1_9GAMM|nr:glycoside hydrolase family 88 protein [Parahaliea aestuarii]